MTKFNTYLFKSPIILSGFFLTLFISGCSSSKKTTRPSVSVEFKQLQQKYATILGVPQNQITNYKLYKWIDKYLNVPYLYGGTTTSGVDCSGFVNIIYLNVYKIQLPRSCADIAKQAKKVNRNHMQEGDLVFFSIKKKNDHVGIYLKNNKFVHASTSKGVVISSLSNTYYKKHFKFAGKITK